MSLLLAQVCAVCDRATNQTFCPDCQRQIRSDRFQALSVEALPSASMLPVGALGIYERTLKPTFRTSNWHIGYLNEAIRITAIFSSMVLNS